jgi:hypothetical protein
MNTFVKVCPICKVEKENTAFNKNNTRYDGIQSTCKSCQQEKGKKYKKENPEKRTLSNIRQRAKRLEIPFDLELSDLEKVDRCPVFNFPLERGKGHSYKASPSVDRIDPTKGYTKDNIQIISNFANTMKQDATKEQLLQFADWIYKTYKDSNENNCVQ